MFVYESEEAILPGVSLARILEKNGLSQKDLALKTGLTEKHISNIIQGKASITEDTAIKLEYVFGGKASFWINLQKNYDEDKARLSFKKGLKAEEKLMKLYPIRLLVKLKFIGPALSLEEKLKSSLKFFGVPSLTLIPAVQAVAFRKSVIKGQKIDQGAVAAWLRIGELKFKEIIDSNPTLAAYNETLFRKSLTEIKRLTIKPDFVSLLPKKLLEYGIILVYSPYLPKTYVSGALRWLGGHPLIQLDDHFKAADSFYFSLFHEFAHILLHDKRADYVDYDQGEKRDLEKEADNWACETLIPTADYQGFIQDNPRLSVAAINSFVKKMEISRDIVIGRLAHDGKISWANRSRLVGKG